MKELIWRQESSSEFKKLFSNVNMIQRRYFRKLYVKKKFFPNQMYMIREQNRTEAHCDYATDQAVPSNISRLKSCSTHSQRTHVLQFCNANVSNNGSHARCTFPYCRSFWKRLLSPLLTCPSCRYLCHLYMFFLF